MFWVLVVLAGLYGIGQGFVAMSRDAEVCTYLKNTGELLGCDSGPFVLFTGVAMVAVGAWRLWAKYMRSPPGPAVYPAHVALPRTPDQGVGRQQQSTSPVPTQLPAAPASDLKSRFGEPWQLGEKEAEQAYDWIVEGTVPSAIPTTSSAIGDLVDKVTPMAMQRVNDMLRGAVTGPTAFPKEMFVAIEQAFRLRLTELFIQRAREA